MYKLLKNVCWGALGVVFSMAFLTGCDDEDNYQPPPISYVSIYNAIPDAPKLDVTVDGMLVNPRAFEFGDNTYYQNFYSGEREFEISPYGANNVVADTTLTLISGNAYSIFMADKYQNAQILATNDSAATPTEGKVKVRLINLSPDASPVSFKIKDDSKLLIENQAFRRASIFVELDPNSYMFEVISSSGDEPILLPRLDLQSGAVRTIVVRGFRNPPAGNTNKICAHVVLN